MFAGLLTLKVSFLHCVCTQTHAVLAAATAVVDVVADAVVTRLSLSFTDSSLFILCGLTP